ncbi:hypothetical protein ABH920_000312 [Catenulispora sp. EB89]|uniref:hypothetical protein n=1 Tax=Catenulispora sp. EB89 TaxID=3156257 RepID=UPI0035127E48
MVVIAMPRRPHSPDRANFTDPVEACDAEIKPGVLRWGVVMSQYVDTYIPRGSDPTWWRVAAEVRRIVKLANPSSSKSAADLLGALARLARFADSEGREGTAKVWLAEEMIERYIDVGCPGVSPASKSNYRSRLRRLRTAVFGPDITTGASTRLPGSVASVPYTTAEMTALWSWSGSQPTVELRAGCRVLMALGRGVGLDSPEAIPLRRHDVVVEGTRDPVLVRVRGDRERVVVCRRAWEQVLRDLATADDDRSPVSYLFRPESTARAKNTVTNFLARTKTSAAVPRLSMGRLRATWLVDLIDSGVALPTIVAAAGVDSLHALSRLMPYVAPVDADTAAAALRGER